MKHFCIELLGVQLLHIEWGYEPEEPDDYRDTQYLMTVGFQPPEHIDEIHVSRSCEPWRGLRLLGGAPNSPVTGRSCGSK